MSRFRSSTGGRPPRPSARLRALLLALLGAAVALVGCEGRRSGPPRIVLVTIDTLRADRVGAYGDAAAQTPHLDSLARQGVRFDQAIAPTPLTLPSHASLMTGLQPPAHGVRHNSVFKLGDDVPVLAERMAEAGYATGAFVAAFVLDARFGLDRGFQTYDDSLGPRSASKTPFAFAERRADDVVDAALEWLETAPERFFLWVHLYDPHAAYDPPSPYKDRISDPYAGEIAFADAQVGRLLTSIGRRFGREGLLVAVTSDHGESLGAHNESTHSYTVYDVTQRVPLILAGPLLPAGRSVGEQVRLVDLAPTLLASAGAEPPAGIEGRSLLPLVRGAEQEEPRPAYVETLATQLDMGWSPLLGVRTPAYKYIRAPQPELYDLAEDPEETRNLALVRPERAKELDGLLEAQLEGARPVEGSTDLSAEDRARLESLGYVVPEEAAFGGDLGVVGGRNPRDHMLDAARAEEAATALAEGSPKRALEILAPLGDGGLYVAKLRARAALAADRPELAVTVLEGLRARGEATAHEIAELGMAYLATGQLEKARATHEAAHASAPELAGPLMGLGLVALAEGDHEAAESWFLRAQEVAPQPEAIRVDRAVLRLDQGRLEAADALLEGIDPVFLAEDPARAMRLARAEQSAGRHERAMALLRRSLRAFPKHEGLLSLQAATLESTGRFEEALQVRQRRHALDPEDPGARNDLAWGLAMAGRELDRALELARDAARDLDDDPNALDTLATVHLVRDEPDRALAVAERALADGSNEGVRLHLIYLRAAALEKLGRPAEARAALRALGSEPGELAPPWRERAEALGARVGLDEGDGGAEAGAVEGA